MIRGYFRQKKRRILLDLVFVGIFASCFYLTEVDLAFVWYPSLLCGVFFVMYVIWDYRKFREKHVRLQELLEQIDETAEYLPDSENQIEEDYQHLLRRLYLSNQECARSIREKLFGNREYITLWAHQMKTPITAMELLLEEGFGNDADKRRKELLSRLFEIEQYVDISLQFVRLDTMNADLLLWNYPLFGIVKQAVKYFARVFLSKRISLHMTEADVVVTTDEKWLLFVLKQILSNALKYTNQGSISIFMHKEKEMTLVIEDTGRGIAAEDLPRIYERGFTGLNGRMQEKSTGIGLYLSKKILDTLSHGIWIDSKEGEGTRVELSLGRERFVK